MPFTLSSFLCALPVAVMLLFIDSVQAAPSGYELIFTDEFNGSSLDTLKWQDKYPWGRTHNHDAYSAPENVILGDGTVTLLAERESHANSSKPFTTGTISTGYNKFTFTGGYVEARVLLPDTPGSWPAFWGLYTGWPPEADIMEYPIDTAAGNGYSQSEYHTAFHYKNGSGGNSAGAGKVNPGGIGDLGGAYHTFGMEWIEDDWVGFYFNGNLVSQFGNDSAIAQMEHMYLILNYAVGGWPGTPNQTEWANGHSDEFKIDWVRVWQQREAKDTRYTDVQGDGFAEWNWESGWSLGSPSQGNQVGRLGTQASASQTMEWDGFETAGQIYFDGDTDYTLGDGNESLLFAMSNGSGWSRIWNEAGTGSHTFNSRVEFWSNLSITNLQSGDLTFNSDIISQARDGYGGVLALRGSSGAFDNSTVINGALHQQRLTTIAWGANVVLGQGMFQTNNLYSDAKLEILDGSTLTIRGLNAAGVAGEGGSDTSLGFLGAESDKLVLDDGTIILRGSTTSFRGFTIGAGGATLLSETLSGVWLRDTLDAQKAIVSTAGGDLTLGGWSDGLLDKPLAGSGGLYKTGSGSWGLGGVSSYTGATVVESGSLNVTGATGSGQTTVMASAVLGGDGLVRGNLVVDGEVNPSGQLDVGGVANFNSGSILAIDLGSGTTDSLAVDGVAAIGAGVSLEVTLGSSPSVGASFDVLTAVGGVTGQFDTLSLPDLGMLDWVITYGANAVSLEVILPGDFNADGVVDTADYAMLRNHYGSPAGTLANDPHSALPVGAAQLATWHANYGASVALSVLSINAAAVPEPCAWLLFMVTGAVLACRR